MAALFADENVHRGLTDALRLLGHDVLTSHQAGRANQKIPDADQLIYATKLGRAGLTNNRRHFHKLHQADPGHAGIITYTRDTDTDSLAHRIHDAIVQAGTLPGLFGLLETVNVESIADVPQSSIRGIQQLGRDFWSFWIPLLVTLLPPRMRLFR